MPDTLSTTELQDLHVQSLPARTVMTAIGVPTRSGVGGLSDVLNDFTGRPSTPLASSSTDDSSTDDSSTDGSSTGGADGQAGQDGEEG